jgi:Divergent CRAL/TRIO domain
VLVVVATDHAGDVSSRLPAMWLIRAYRALSRPFKKNVRYIILVRPSRALSAMMVLLRPFVSIKAARKVRKVGSCECSSALPSLKPVGCSLSFLGRRIGHLGPIW